MDKTDKQEIMDLDLAIKRATLRGLKIDNIIKIRKERRNQEAHDRQWRHRLVASVAAFIGGSIATLFAAIELLQKSGGGG